jgi:multiple sugar transport system ATP-binding protein
MKKGRVQQFDAPLNIYDRPANRFVAEFVGSPGMNFINGHLDIPARRFVSDGLELTLDESQFESLKTVSAEQQVTLGIRPEHVTVSAGARAGWLPAKVYVTELMGNETLVFLNLGGNRIIARAPSEFRAEVESDLWVQVDVSKAHFFDEHTGEVLPQKPTLPHK